MALYLCLLIIEWVDFEARPVTFVYLSFPYAVVGCFYPGDVRLVLVGLLADNYVAYICMDVLLLFDMVCISMVNDEWINVGACTF